MLRFKQRLDPCVCALPLTLCSNKWCAPVVHLSCTCRAPVVHLSCACRVPVVHLSCALRACGGGGGVLLGAHAAVAGGELCRHQQFLQNRHPPMTLRHHLTYCHCLALLLLTPSSAECCHRVADRRECRQFGRVPPCRPNPPGTCPSRRNHCISIKGGVRE